MSKVTETEELIGSKAEVIYLVENGDVSVRYTGTLNRYIVNIILTIIAIPFLILGILNLLK